MAPAGLKYNPGLLGDEELVRGFVVRGHELDLILEVVRENDGPSNQHVLVVGPRGIGKTTLVRRVGIEVRRDSALAAAWYPIVFSEEAYLAGSPGEFWLETVSWLADQTGSESWRRTYEDLKDETDDARLRERALAHVTDFSDQQGKRLLIICENLNMILGEQLVGYEDWDLRHTLVNEPRIMLLATATSRFDEVANVSKAWYELLRMIDLRPLNGVETATLWESLTGRPPGRRRLRPIQILTGGNPRLLRILADFAERTSFRELMDNLIHLIDEHTEYFKSQLDSLAPVERKVFAALLDIWEPSSARDVAAMARLEVSKTSSLLGRLVARGAAVVAGGPGRKQLYQAAERMYNIYYLMRRHGHPSNRVQAVVRFMVAFYQGEDLIKMTGQLAEEACGLDSQVRQEHYWAYDGIMRYAETELRSRIVSATPREFFLAVDMPEQVRRFYETIQSKPAGAQRPAPPTSTNGRGGTGKARQGADYWCQRGYELMIQGRLPDAEDAYRRAVKRRPSFAKAWGGMGLVLHKMQQYPEAEQAYLKALELDPHPLLWASLGDLQEASARNYDVAEAAYRKAIELDSACAYAWGRLGMLQKEFGRLEEAEQSLLRGIEADSKAAFIRWVLGNVYESLNRPDRAEQTWRALARIDPDSQWAWGSLGFLYRETGRYEEAKRAFRKALKLAPDAILWRALGELLHNNLARPKEAERAYQKAIDLDPQSYSSHLGLAELLEDEGRYSEAELSYRRAIELRSDSVSAWAQLADLLLHKLDRLEEADHVLRQMIEATARDPEAWLQYGQALEFGFRRYGAAEESYRKAIELKRDFANAWILLGQILDRRLARYEEAEVACREVIALAPDRYEGWMLLAQVLDDHLGRYEEAHHAYRKGIELQPDSALAWGRLGSLLQVKLKQPEEAERAYRRGIDLEPRSGMHWAMLADLLREPFRRLDEAEQAYRRALELNPELGWVWDRLGRLLQEQERYDEAESAYQELLKLNGKSLAAWRNLVSLWIDRGDDLHGALERSQPHLDASGRPAEVLDAIAWSIYVSGLTVHLSDAEALAAEAVLSNPESWSAAHTLATILGAQGRWTEALGMAPVFVDSAEREESALQFAIEFSISAAAAGYGEDALNVVVASASRPALEPLEVGLRIFLGKAPSTPQEVLEVGQDIADRIVEFQAECTS